MSEPVEHHAVVVRRLRRSLAEQAHELTELARNRGHLGVRRDQCRQPITARQSFFEHRNPGHKTGHEGTSVSPAWRAAARQARRSSLDMRKDSRTCAVGATDTVSSEAATRAASGPKASARAALKNSDGETPRARACSTSAAFMPRKSTHISSRDEGVFTRDSRTCSERYAAVPPPLSCTHQRIHLPRRSQPSRRPFLAKNKRGVAVTGLRQGLTSFAGSPS